MRGGRNLKACGLVAGGVALGLLTAPGMALAAQITQVWVSNDVAHPVPVQGVGTQQVAGSVSVSNLPANPTPRRGQGLLMGSSPTVTLPAGVVVTDVSYFDNGGCQGGQRVRLQVGEPGAADSYTYDFVPGYGRDELHLQSGLRSTSDAPVTVTERSFTSPTCIEYVNWSGYTG